MPLAAHAQRDVQLARAEPCADVSGEFAKTYIPGAKDESTVNLSCRGVRRRMPPFLAASAAAVEAWRARRFSGASSPQGQGESPLRRAWTA